MIESYPVHPEPSLSLPIRMEKRRKRLRLGVIALAIGTALGAAGGYGFTIRGSELIAGWLTLMALGALGLGVSSVIRASKDH